MPLRAFDGVFAEVHGTGRPAVVALHGWGRRGSDFDAVLRGRDAVAVDLPGFGATPPPAAPIGASGYAALLDPVLAAVDIPVVVVGHSFGGRVAVALAAQRPDVVRGLVLTGVPLLRLRPARRPSVAYRMVRVAHRMGAIPDERMEHLRRTRGSVDYRAATGVMREVLVTVVNESYEDELRRITVPVAMVWGGEDREAPPEVAERARGILTEAGAAVTVEVLPGVGHMVPVSAPERIAAAIDGMLG